MRIPPLCLKLLFQLFPFHPYPSFQKDGNGQRECMSIPWARSFPLHGTGQNLGSWSWTVGFSQFSSIQSLSRVRLFVTPWTASQASLSITNSWNLLKLMSIELVMSSNHLILCHPLLLLPSVFPSIRVFFQGVSSPHQVANEWGCQLQHQSFQWTFRRTEFPLGFPLGWTGWISLQSKGLSRVFSNTTVQIHQFFGTQLSS